MKSRISLLFLMSLLFVSCGEKNKESKNETDSNNYKITVEGIFAKNDKVQVFYLTKGDQWKDENSVSKTVYASNDLQKIEVEFPENVKPENVRVDLGFNSSQNYVTIKDISIKYKDKEINGDFEGYQKYFYPNEFVSWDPDYFGYKLSKVNNNYDPFLMGNDLLKQKLTKFNE